jgi:hypothetical protein
MPPETKYGMGGIKVAYFYLRDNWDVPTLQCHVQMYQLVTGHVPIDNQHHFMVKIATSILASEFDLSVFVKIGSR